MAESTKLRITRQLAGWCAKWGLPGFEHGLTITFSHRFRSALGRCAPASREIRLAEFLLAAPAALLEEALCHEAAHAAVYELHGAGLKPHGTEWRRLMQQVGFEPRVRFPAELLPVESVMAQRCRARRYWLHQCPVCDVSRVARTHVGRWRCASCVETGLDGRLVVTRIDAAQLKKVSDG